MNVQFGLATQAYTRGKEMHFSRFCPFFQFCLILFQKCAKMAELM